MAKIQVEIGGQLQDVTKAQLFELAKNGDIAPETRLVVDGKETKARKAQGIEFAEDVGTESSEVLPSADNPFLYPDTAVPPPAPVSVPVPVPNPVPQVEMTNWFDTKERKHPESFCASINSAIGLTDGLFQLALLVYALAFSGGIIGVLANEDRALTLMFGGMIIWSVVTFPFFLLSWKVSILFLQSMRATFCHQHAVERLLQSQKQGDDSDTPSP